MEEKKWQAGGPPAADDVGTWQTTGQFHRHGADEIIAEIIPYRIHGSSQSDFKQLGSTSLRYKSEEMEEMERQRLRSNHDNISVIGDDKPEDATRNK